LVAGYLHAGYAVVGTARTMPSTSSPDLLSVEGDITDPETSKRIVELTLERYGRIDTLINDAGIYIGKPFSDYTLDDYTAMTAVNLKGFFLITQSVLEHMVTQGAGHIVNVSTSLVDHADSTRPAALAVLTKGGLAAVTRSLAMEYASRGVRANAVSLGVIKTPEQDPNSYDSLAALHPL
jgi:NAD(P)-dependent dehydrogenase (short-subunit alcohol dehydrogenase family)